MITKSIQISSVLSIQLQADTGVQYIFYYGIKYVGTFSPHHIKKQTVVGQWPVLGLCKLTMVKSVRFSMSYLNTSTVSLFPRLRTFGRLIAGSRRTQTTVRTDSFPAGQTPHDL